MRSGASQSRSIPEFTLRLNRSASRKLVSLSTKSLERNETTYLCDKYCIAFFLCHTMQYNEVLHPDRPAVFSFPEADGLGLCPAISIASPILKDFGFK